MNTAQSIAPKPAALPPATPALAPANPAGAGPSFAQFLTVQAPPPVQPRPAAPEAAPAPSQRKAQQQAAPAPKPAKAGTPEAKAEQPAAKPKSTSDAAPAEAKDDTVAPDDEAPETQGLNEFTQLLGLVPPQPATPVAPETAAAAGGAHRGARAAAAQDDDAEAATGRPRTSDRAAGVGTDAAATRPADAARGKLAEQRADKAAASRDAESTQASATVATQSPPQARPADTAPASFAAVLAQALPAGNARPDAPTAATEARLHAPLHSPAFAPEVAGRISLLAVDGVQQAQLQLNPADMGPVSVQIIVDGSQAQVSFHAAQAETRQALEQSLPELAAALQGQGLTLSGGGVFQQSARDNGHASGEAQATVTGQGGGDLRGGDDDAIRTAGAPPARRSVGLLDTFA